METTTNQNSLSERILYSLSQTDGLNSLQLAREYEEDHQKVVGALKSLQSLGSIIAVEQLSEAKLELTAEGEICLKKGSHEARIHGKVSKDGIPLSILLEGCSEMDENSKRVGFNNAAKLGWLKVIKDSDGNSSAVRIVEDIEDNTRSNLELLKSGSELEKEPLEDLKKRKLIAISIVHYYMVRRGKEFTTEVVKQEAELTSDLLINNEYERRAFKPYNFNALGSQLPSGQLHPLMKVRSEFLSILTEMGFSEMPTNRYVESSFWNFDALFVPQKHPARDVQDTFFLSEPKVAKNLPKEYMEKVKRVHSEGDYGSQGYRTEWKEEEARKNVLRTHTTAISARILYELGQNKPFVPVKKFSIDRVFRNETLDATHLAEFHQVEGFVADRNLSLAHLIGVMTEFFRRLGIDQLRFKPAFNPYTEPSMEVFAFHKGLKKWVEVGNSGVFRPEMLLPMGLPEDVRVIAWGLSLERPTMIRYGIDNIRSLVGPRVDLRMVYNNPLCRLDKV